MESPWISWILQNVFVVAIVVLLIFGLIVAWKRPRWWGRITLSTIFTLITVSYGVYKYGASNLTMYAYETALALERGGNYRTAITGFQNALNLVPNSEPARKADILYHLGICFLFDRTNLRESEDNLNKALAIDTQLQRLEPMARDYEALARLNESQGKVKETCGFWKSAGILYQQIGRIEEAERLQQLRQKYCKSSDV
jgi:tetratricopeptide (TPR) repeat protein